MANLKTQMSPLFILFGLLAIAIYGAARCERGRCNAQWRAWNDNLRDGYAPDGMDRSRLTASDRKKINL